MKKLTDVEFARVDDKSLLLDLMLPEGAGTPTPLILWIHGGGWEVGDKEWLSPLPGMESELLERGFAVASINYRLSQEAVFPAQLEDCKAAVRWLRAHAADYGLDADRFGVSGHSAGGHLTALVGTSGDSVEFDVGEYQTVSSRVQAACPLSAPTDVSKMDGDHNKPDSPESRLIGAPVLERADLVARANPITYVTKDSPPFLLIHGDQDDVVVCSQSELLHEALVTAGADSTLRLVSGADHNFQGVSEDVLRGLVAEVCRFFEGHLRA